MTRTGQLSAVAVIAGEFFGTRPSREGDTSDFCVPGIYYIYTPYARTHTTHQYSRK